MAILPVRRAHLIVRLMLMVIGIEDSSAHGRLNAATHRRALGLDRLRSVYAPFLGLGLTIGAESFDYNQEGLRSRGPCMFHDP